MTVNKGGDTNGCADVFVHDLLTGVTERVSVSTVGEQGNGVSYASSKGMSGNGLCMAFYSVADNLVAGDTNGAADIFVRIR